jgi:ABC-type multidrug transport system permease subunit
VGTRLSAYLSSKLILLLGLIALQTLLFAAVLFVLRPLDTSASGYAGVVGLLAATGATSVAMGLLVSSLVRTQAQATSLIPLAVIPQLIFAGAIVPVARMADPARALADVVFAQWSLAGLGSAIDMNARLSTDPEFTQVNRFGTHFFDIYLGAAFAAEAIFTVLFVAATALVLRRSLRV